MPSAQLSGRPIWLSGPILTLLNKIVFPVIWLTIVVEVPVWVFATKGRINIAPGFGFIVLFVLVATVFMVWLTVHLQRVGHCGRSPSCSTTPMLLCYI